MEEDKLHKIQKPHWIFTILWLIYRNLLIVVRDPTVQKLRIVQKIVNEDTQVFLCFKMYHSKLVIFRL